VPPIEAGGQEAFVSSSPASRKANASARRDGEIESKRVWVLRKERIVTLTREPAVERPVELREQEIKKLEHPPVAPPNRIRWFEWALGIVLVGAVALAATLLMTQSTEPEAESTLVLGVRQTDGVVFVPEYVGLSGGDLPAIESSPLALGVRHTDGVVFVPEYVGLSGGDLPAIESSPLVLGVRHTDGVVFVPAYVGHADGVYPETSR
jgi:hypothetical protein